MRPPGDPAWASPNGALHVADAYWLPIPPHWDAAATQVPMPPPVDGDPVPAQAAPVRLPSFDQVALDERLLHAAQTRPSGAIADAITAAAEAARTQPGGGGGGGARPSAAKRVRKPTAAAAAAALPAPGDTDDEWDADDGADRDMRRRAKAAQRGVNARRSGAAALPVTSTVPPGSAFLPSWWDDDATVAQNPSRALSAHPPGTAPGTPWSAVPTAFTLLARNDIPAAAKQAILVRSVGRGVARRLSDACAGVVRGRCTRSFRLQQSGTLRIKRLARDALSLWRRLEKEGAESRRKLEREQADAARLEEELREAKRQQQRLNFLLTQTELYAHFMASKQQPKQGQQREAAAAADGAAAAPGGAVDAEAEQLEAQARDKAMQAAAAAKAAAAAFDAGRDGAAAGPSDEAAAMEVDGVEVACPPQFQAQLKGYQLAGLRWLVNAYDSGINCMLADEMGLGKTVQALAFLSYLAEQRNMWGPFLVVTPSSTLPNWADEVRRFCPHLKLCPYWGTASDRQALRRSLFDSTSSALGTRDAPWHILVTSYQLLVCDEKYLRRTKWHFMVCDEAQALKSASSGRWKTLLGFSCRNRLLLTGTPVQNTMAELWALLHFIMPQLFDSHDQFAAWFSKGVEGAVQDGAALNAHQLARLHAVLKPFMLRRVKADVESEMAPKTEHLLRCALAPRQQALYAALKARISIADLLAAAGTGLTERKAMHLMNVVIQLRKVCNHPELFEARPPRASLRWGAPPAVAPPPPTGATAAALAALGAGGGGGAGAFPTGDAGAAGGSGASRAESVYGPECGGGHGWSSSLITWPLPKLLWRHGLPCLTGAPFTGGLPPAAWSAVHSPGSGLCIWSAPRVAHAALTDTTAWGWTRLVDLSPGQLVSCATAAADPVTAWTLHTLWHARSSTAAPAPHADHASDAASTASQRATRLSVIMPARVSPHWHCDGGDDASTAPLLVPISTRFLTAAPLLRAVQCYMPVCTAPPVRVVCSDRSFAVQQGALGADPALWLLFTGDEAIALGGGTPREARTHAPHPLLRRLAAERWPLAPLWGCVANAFGCSSPSYKVEDYSLAAALADSGKMQTLDALLRERFAGGHKCLVFSQMTKMLDLLEAYCRFRKWKYVRLDGSTSVADRRDMVKAWQAPGDTHFVFLLSTRAGGLGINLTAADTVIFYDNDWNPTMDSQAMDRAHRLGQQRPVAVYRLVCAATVEERILLRAQQKQTVQALVMAGDANAAAQALAGAAGGGGVTDGSSGDVFAPEEVVSLLLDDEELAAQIAASRQQRARAPLPGGAAAKRRNIRMADDGETVLVDDDAAAAAPGGGDDPAAGGAEAPKAKAAPKRRQPAAPKAAPKAAAAPALPAAPPPPKPSAPPQAPQPVAAIQPLPAPAAPPAGDTPAEGGGAPVKMSFKIKLKTPQGIL